MTIGERVRQLRGKKSLAEFGSEIGVSATQMSRIETDQSKPSLDLAEKICDKYNVTLDWLLRGIEHTAKVAPDSESITISKDEFIELQRMALRREKEEKAELIKKLEEVKNS